MLAVGCAPPDPEWAHEWRLAGRTGAGGDGDLRPLLPSSVLGRSPLKAILVMRPHKIYCAHAELWAAAGGRHGEGGPPGAGRRFWLTEGGGKECTAVCGAKLLHGEGWSGSICSSNGIVNHAAEG